MMKKVLIVAEDKWAVYILRNLFAIKAFRISYSRVSVKKITAAKLKTLFKRTDILILSATKIDNQTINKIKKIKDDLLSNVNIFCATFKSQSTWRYALQKDEIATFSMSERCLRYFYRKINKLIEHKGK